MHDQSTPKDPGRPPGSIRPHHYAGEAAEAVRLLDHATIVEGDGRGYREPSEVDATLAELSVLAFRLPQALAQARTWLNRRHLAGALAHDTTGRALGPVMTQIGVALNDAIAAAGELGHCLDDARQYTAHLRAER
jgi:hypothetical protein